MSVGMAPTASQHLTFTLDGERFALDIGRVREVLEFTGVTRVPRMPAFVRGVINLRGSVVPVVDLRLKFGLSPTPKDKDTCVVISEVDLDGEATVLGLLADSVQEVIDLEPGEIDPPPRLGSRLDTAFLKGMGKRGDRFLLLLEIDRVFSGAEIREMGGARTRGEADAEG